MLLQNLRSLALEVVRKYREKGGKVDCCVAAAFAARYDCQSRWKDGSPTLADELTDQEISGLAEQMALMLESENPAALRNVQILVEMEAAFLEQKEVVKKEQDARDQEGKSLMDAICRGGGNFRDSSYSAFFEKIHEYACLKCGVRLTQCTTAAAEVRTALTSVMPFSTLASFLSLQKEEKEEQLATYSHVVLGIWMYNEHRGVSATHVSPDASSCITQGGRLLERIEDQFERLKSEIRIGDTRLRGLHGDKQMAAELRAGLLLAASALAFCQRIAKDTKCALDFVHRMRNEADSLLEQVHGLVSGNNSVSKSDVYPLFTKLGRTQTAVFEEQRMLVARHRLVDLLVDLVGDINCEDTCTPVAGDISESEGMGLVECECPPLPSDLDMAEAVAGTSRSEESDLRPEDQAAYAGFCPVTLARRGIPILHDPKLGFVRYEGKMYGFCEPLARDLFAASPCDYIDAVVSACKAEPLLVNLLALPEGNFMPDIPEIIQRMKEPFTCSFGTQTPTHFVEEHIDRDYTWNVWTMRRRALALADVRNKATHHCQTSLSHFRRDSTTQVWKPKDAHTQSQINKGQTMPRKVRYIAGLRGPPEVKMNVVSLELDVGQSHQY